MIFLRLLFTSILVFIFFASSYRLAEGNEAIWTYSMYGSFIVLMLLVLLFKVKRIRYNKVLITLMALFSFTIFFSALKNQAVALFFNSLLFFVMFVAMGVVVNSYFKESTEKVVAYTVVISHIPVLLFPVITDGFDTVPYKGIFDNPNALGLVAATVFAVLASIFISKVEKTMLYKEKPSKLVMLGYLVSMIFLFVLVIFSASRTSVLVAVATVLAGVILFLSFAIKQKRLASVIVKTVMSIPLILGVYLLVSHYVPINFYLEQNIISKFERKQSDLLDGRGDVWSRTAGDAGLFGNGESYFNESVGLGAHNTFVYIMGVYGWVPLIMFVLFIVVSLIFSIRYTLKSENDFKYLPLIMIITFIMLSMGENVVYRLSMVVAFAMAGVASNNKEVIVTVREPSQFEHKIS